MIRATRWLGSGGARSRAVVFGAAYAFACGCFLLAWSLASGAQKPAPGAIKAVTAERFVLVDRDGRERAKLGLDASGSPRFDLIDAHGVSRVVVRLDRDGQAAVRVCGDDGMPRAMAAAAADGTASVGVIGPGGQMAVQSASPGGAVGFQLQSAGGEAKWAAALGPDGGLEATP